MSTDQTHEHIHSLAHELEQFRDELTKRDTTGEDHERLAKMSADLNDALTAAEELKKADRAIGASSDFLGKHPDPTIEVEATSGIVNPNAGNLTLGEAVTKSPGYAEFLDQFVGADGQIQSGVALNKRIGFTPEGGSFYKTIVTGASDTSGGAFVENYRYGQTADLAPFTTGTVRDLCTTVPIQSDAFEFVQVTAKTNAAAATAEATTADRPAVYDDPASGEKPESAMTTAVIVRPVETMAHYIPVTRRAAADGGQLSTIIDRFLREGLADTVESQLLVGTGTSPQLEGFLDAGASVPTVGSAGTDLDAIVDAIRTVTVAGYKPNALVIHPNDWYSDGFVTAKDGVSGAYMIANPGQDPTLLNSLWGLQVVVTSNITENTALVGQFSQAVIGDRQQATIYVTDSHQDWFARNILAVLAEERLAFGLMDPAAFCTVTAV